MYGRFGLLVSVAALTGGALFFSSRSPGVPAPPVGGEGLPELTNWPKLNFAGQASDEPAPGQLTILREGKVTETLCPLQGTAVKADISGFGARVRVVQVFANPTKETIEAVYTFPLPSDAAVDRMTMHVGDRVIEGQIKPRDQARRIYEAARAEGQTAALLDQERPNIFTQSVANITPGARVQIEISYVQVLKFEEGTYEFMFPMVVGPRYLGNAPDPDRIAPPITPKGTRTGANIELTVDIDAGAPIRSLDSKLHTVDVQKGGQNQARVTLAKKDEIPNRDFILRYSVATDSIRDTFVAHTDSGRGGFFTLGLLPPKAPTEQDATPREFIFVMDQSGSQSGFPIEKSKELTLKLIETLRPKDTFNVMGFNTSVRSLWSAPRPNTRSNIDAARAFVTGMQANGGTHIREGVVAALQGQDDPNRLRIVVFNTDGYVGDEDVILDTLQKTRGTARMFVFGIGNSVNRFLIDAMAAEGRGASEVVTLAERADEAVARFIKRTRTPVLVDVSMELEGIEATDLEPVAIPDVFDGAPVYVFGRYLNPGQGKITIRGKHRGQPWSRTISVELPQVSDASAIPTLWARRRVDSLTRENWTGRFSQEGKNLEAAITDLALEFGIMTEYTSFVAVEERVVNVGGRQRRVRVPVEMADGVSYEGVGANVQSLSYGPVLRSRAGKSVAGGGVGGGLPAARPAIMSEDAEIAGRPLPMTPEQKLHKILRQATGKVEVQVWLRKLDDEIVKALEKAGLKVEAKDQRLRIAFGTIDAKRLIELAKLAEVERIDPLEG